MASNMTWEECAANRENIEYVKDIKQDLEAPNEDPYLFEKIELVKAPNIEDHTKPQIKEIPLFELSSVMIHGHKDGSFEISGHIILFTADDDEFVLFQRDWSDAVLMPGNRPATLSKSVLGRPYLFLKPFEMVVSLRDYSPGVLLNDVHLFDFSGKIDYDKELELQLNFGDRLVTLCYTIFQCAVVAFVEFTVFRNEGSASGSAGCSDIEDFCVGIEGTIIAVTKMRDMNVSRPLLQQGLSVVYWDVNSPTCLCALAIPVSSSLIIEADLVVEQEKIVFSVEFEADKRSHQTCTREIVEGNWRLLVGVTWKHASDLLTEGESYELVSSHDAEGASFEGLSERRESNIEECRNSGAEGEDISDMQKNKIEKHEEKRPQDETLLPQMTIHRDWEKHATPATIEYVKFLEQELQKPKVDPYLHTLIQRLKESSLRVPLRYHVLATTVFELSSVSILWDAMELDAVGPQFLVYGQIKLTDHDGNDFLLFNRDWSDPECVYMLDNSSAILPKSELDRPLLLPKSFSLKLHLIDKNQGVDIVNDETFLDFSGNIGNVDYDEEQRFRFNQGNRLVIVHYTIFQCAALASVEFTVVKNEERGGTGDKKIDELCDVDVNGSWSDDLVKVVVNGSIFASSKVRDSRNVSRLLFGKRFTSEKLLVNAHTKLSVVAVPAYSSLRIEADLNVDGERIASSDAIEFKPNECSNWTCKKEFVGKSWRILVCVTWKHAYDFLKEDEFFELVSNKPCSEESETLLEGGDSSIDECRKFGAESEAISFKGKNSTEKHQEKRPRLLANQQLSDMRILGPSITDYDEELVEVFSISVHPFNDDGNALGLFGSITSRDSGPRFNMFERHEKNPDLVYPNGTVLLQEPCHSYEGPFFCVKLDLKDAEGRVISEGMVGGWNHMTVSKWLDRRICSIVSGRDGFAAVHYTIFKFALEVLPQVIIRSDLGCQVHGRICAWYSNHKYDTDYEKKYYRSMIFEKGESEFVVLDGGDVSLPLSKAVVAVPRGASLIVEADLHVRLTQPPSLLSTLKGKATFKPLKPNSQSTLQTIGPDSTLSVCLVWR